MASRKAAWLTRIGRVAGDGQRHSGHADGEERKLVQQLHGSIQEKPLGKAVQPLSGSKAQTVTCPLQEVLRRRMLNVGGQRYTSQGQRIRRA